MTFTMAPNVKPLSNFLPYFISDPDTCNYVTINGFLKTQCSVNYKGLVYDVLKCPSENGYYQAVDLKITENQQVYSKACQNDTHQYQVCGVIAEQSRRNYGDYFLCSYHLCHDQSDTGPGYGKYSSGGMMDVFMKCNGKEECTGGEDEISCDDFDPDIYYTCAHYDTKILKSQICDGVYDCLMGEDENGSCDHKTGLFCEDYSGIVAWVHPSYICVPSGSGWNICKDGSDSKDCDIHEGGRWCEDGLRGGQRYIKEFQMCYHTQGKGALDYKVCSDGRDQLNCTNVALTCKVDGFPTTISSYGLCQGHQQCEDAFDDECNFAETSCYLHKHQFCDKKFDCGHKSDEKAAICQEVTPNFKCARRVSTSSVELLHMPYSWLCDGVVDCFDGSDEDFSVWKVCGSQNTVIRCIEKTESCSEMFKCPGEEIKFSRIHSLCDHVEECAGENRICQESRGMKDVLTVAISQNKETKILSYRCLPGMNGDCKLSQTHKSPDQNLYGVSPTIIKFTSQKVKVSCKFFFGELYVYHSCNDLCSDALCPLSSLPYHSCSDLPEKVITFAEDFLTRQQYLTVAHKQEGKYDNNLFACENRKCVTYEKVCNLADDCGDGSDEENCVNNYRCNKSAEFVPLSSVCDGRVDCLDLSDECNDNCQLQIINSIVLKVVAWSFGLLATVSNLAVVARKLSSLRRVGTKTTLFNSFFVICIGVGDAMVGLYLLGVSVADTIYSTSYCTSRFDWLNSGYCTSLGVLSTAGSILSLFSMTCLSLFRIHSIRNIFSSRLISRTSQVVLVLIVALIFFLAAVIVSIPVLEMFEDYFLNGIYYGNVALFIGAPSKQNHIQILEQYYGRLKDSLMTWKVARKLVGEMFTNDHGGISGSDQKFYGNAGVCLFKYIVTEDDPQRFFSLAILSINCLLCFLITVSYFGVYILSRTSMSMTGTNTSSSLERKISLIIVTDFLAWIPFIIICYLHYFKVFDGSSLYTIFSIVILPMNSVLNPMIYDDTYSLLGRRVVQGTKSGLGRVSVSQIKRKITTFGGSNVENPTNMVYLNDSFGVKSTAATQVDNTTTDV